VLVELLAVAAAVAAADLTDTRRASWQLLAAREELGPGSHELSLCFLIARPLTLRTRGGGLLLDGQLEAVRFHVSSMGDGAARLADENSLLFLTNRLDDVHHLVSWLRIRHAARQAADEDRGGEEVVEGLHACRFRLEHCLEVAPLLVPLNEREHGHDWQAALSSLFAVAVAERRNDGLAAFEPDDGERRFGCEVLGIQAIGVRTREQLASTGDHEHSADSYPAEVPIRWRLPSRSLTSTSNSPGKYLTLYCTTKYNNVNTRLKTLL
jgi:hypothetical protein